MTCTSRAKSGQIIKLNESMVSTYTRWFTPTPGNNLFSITSHVTRRKKNAKTLSTTKHQLRAKLWFKTTFQCRFFLETKTHKKHTSPTLKLTKNRKFTLEPHLHGNSCAWLFCDTAVKNMRTIDKPATIYTVFGSMEIGAPALTIHERTTIRINSHSFHYTVSPAPKIQV